MLERARRARPRWGSTNVELHESLIEALPLDDASVDVVISNGVIDLVPDKDAVFDEIDRVLRPGGRLQLADVIIHHEVSEDARAASTSGPAESPARCSRASTRACWSSGPTPTSPRATSSTPTRARRSRTPAARRRSSAPWDPRSARRSRRPSAAVNHDADPSTADAAIYLDHNATTPIAPEVLEAMRPYLEDRFGTPRAGHGHGYVAVAHRASRAPEPKSRRCSAASRTASSSPRAVARPGTSRKRLKGLEPSTFCMASRPTSNRLVRLFACKAP